MKKHRSRRIAGQNKKVPAWGFAANEHSKRENAKEFGKLLRDGAFDYPATNDEIERVQG